MRRRTSKELETLLLASAREAVAIARGELKPARIVTRSLTARDVDVSPPPSYNAKRVQGVRDQMRVSQTVFASVLNVSPSLVRAWEQGVRTPSGPATRLLQVLERRPEKTLRVFERPKRQPITK